MLSFLLLGPEVLMAGLASFADLLERGLPILICAVTKRRGEGLGSASEIVRVGGEALPILPD